MQRCSSKQPQPTSSLQLYCTVHVPVQRYIVPYMYRYSGTCTGTGTGKKMKILSRYMCSSGRLHECGTRVPDTVKNIFLHVPVHAAHSYMYHTYIVHTLYVCKTMPMPVSCLKYMYKIHECVQVPGYHRICTVLCIVPVTVLKQR